MLHQHAMLYEHNYQSETEGNRNPIHNIPNIDVVLYEMDETMACTNLQPCMMKYIIHLIDENTKNLTKEQNIEDTQKHHLWQK